MDLSGQLDNAAGTVVTLVTTYGLRVLGAMAILIAGWIASRGLYSVVERLCGRSQHIDRTVALFLANAAKYLMLGFTFVAVLTTFGIATASFVAVLGAFGVAVGLAIQGTLSNLAAGVMLIVFRPFHVGDRIETGGVAGTAQEINLFYTEIDGDDNARIIIPNGKLWGEIVKVTSRNETERVELKFTRPLSDDIQTAIARVRELAKRDKRVTQLAQIGVESVADANYVLVARLWVPRGDAMQVHFDVNRAVIEEFQRRAPNNEGARAAD